MKMTAYLMIITGSSLMAFNAHAAQTFKGSAAAAGNWELNCTDSASSYPAPALAEVDATQQAANFCDTFSMKEIKVSDWTYSTDCQVVNKGFVQASTLYTYAAAQFRCQSQS